MSTRTTYPPGAPCWVAQLDPDIDAAQDFYGAVFGWTFENIAEDGNPPFLIASLDGHRVASLAGPIETGTWITAVAVRDLAETKRAVVAAGGSAPGDSVEIATLGRFHRLADPAGAEIHIAEFLDDPAAVRTTGSGSWSMSSLHVSEPDSVTAFYESVFGWRTEQAGPVTFFRLPGHSVGDPDQPYSREVVGALGQSDGDARWLPHFRVEDADATATTALAHGGQVVSPPADNGLGFRMAVLADSAGGTFSISQTLDAI